ncbi:MAG: glycosyltransferase [Candidatus Lutacidiplasmatales archaeon]
MSGREGEAGPVPATPSPRVAVIIGAYRRETYVREAVSSVLAQSVPRSLLEILVTKNFASPTLDPWLSREGVRGLRDDDPHIGPWLWRAISATRAPLLAFLDDDDVWEPDRIARVLAAFDRYPELGYYRNRVRVMDGLGRPIPEARWGKHELDPELDRTGPLFVGPGEKVVRLPDLRRTHPLFNSSSIVVRREVLDGPVLDRFLETQNPDPFLFLAAVISPFGLYLDDQRSTRYRRHPENITRTLWAVRHGFDDSVRLAELAERSAPAPYAAWLRARSVAIEKRVWTETIAERVAAGVGREEMARLGAGYLRFLARHPEVVGLDGSTWAAPAYASAYLVSPGAVRQVRAGAARTRS